MREGIKRLFYSQADRKGEGGHPLLAWPPAFVKIFTLFLLEYDLNSQNGFYLRIPFHALFVRLGRSVKSGVQSVTQFMSYIIMIRGQTDLLTFFTNSWPSAERGGVNPNGP